LPVPAASPAVAPAPNGPRGSSRAASSTPPAQPTPNRATHKPRSPRPAMLSGVGLRAIVASNARAPGIDHTIRPGRAPSALRKIFQYQQSVPRNCPARRCRQCFATMTAPARDPRASDGAGALGFDALAAASSFLSSRWSRDNLITSFPGRLYDGRVLELIDFETVGHLLEDLA